MHSCYFQYSSCRLLLFNVYSLSAEMYQDCASCSLLQSNWASPTLASCSWNFSVCMFVCMYRTLLNQTKLFALGLFLNESYGWHNLHVSHTVNLLWTANRKARRLQLDRSGGSRITKPKGSTASCGVRLRIYFSRITKPKGAMITVGLDSYSSHCIMIVLFHFSLKQPIKSRSMNTTLNRHYSAMTNLTL